VTLNGLRSIRSQLILSLLVCIASIAIILFFIVQSYASRLAEDSQDQILQASATSMLDGIVINNGEVLVDIPYSSLSMLGTLSDDRVFYLITLDEEILTGYEDLPVVDTSENGAQFGFQTSEYRDNVVRTVTGQRSITLNANRLMLVVTVAQTRDRQAEVLRGILKNTLLLCLGFFVMASLIGLIAVHVSLSPLRQFAEAISRRGPHDLSLVVAPAPKEMQPLADSLNQLIDRLRSSLVRTEDFLTEAAHRVRTPLATVRAEAEVALHRVEKDQNRHSLRTMIRAIDQTSRAAGQLIDHAMVSYRTDSLGSTRVNVSGLCEEVVARLAPVAELRDIALRLNTVDECVVLGDAILLQIAVQNVLDNAVKYSPRDSVIDVDTHVKDRAIHIRVIDEGIGFKNQDAEKLKERFTRGDNASHIAGSGLGLTIVSEVITNHGGSLELGRREDQQGAIVTIVLPVFQEEGEVA